LTLEYLALRPAAAGFAASTADVDGRVAIGDDAGSAANISRNFLRELRRWCMVNCIDCDKLVM
jgi:hypothetical protein